MVAGGRRHAVLLSRALDDSGNLEAGSAGCGRHRGRADCPCSIWSARVVPSIVDAGPDAAVELGVKFRADVRGFVTGVRFYKSAANSGVHIGSLWTSSGHAAGERDVHQRIRIRLADGDFDVPVAIDGRIPPTSPRITRRRDTTRSPRTYFAPPASTAALHALANGVSPNGVFRYGAAAVPEPDLQRRNYWVDVVFDTSSVDTTAPRVLSTNPATASAVPVPSRDRGDLRRAAQRDRP